MTTKEAALALNISHRKVQRLIAAKRLRADRIGKRLWVLSTVDIEKFKESREKVASGSVIGPSQSSGDAVAPPLKVLPGYFHMTDERHYAPLQPRSSAGELTPALQGGPLTNVPCAVSGNWPSPQTMKARGERAAQELEAQYRQGR